MRIKKLTISSTTPCNGGQIVGQVQADILLNQEFSNEEIGEMFRNLLNALDTQIQFTPAQNEIQDDD